MPTLSARLAVQSVTDYGSSQSVHLTAVHSADPANPNASFSKFTPSAELKLVITNRDAFGFFVAGQSYDLLFSPQVQAAAPAPAETPSVASEPVQAAAPAPVSPEPVSPEPVSPAPVAQAAAETETAAASPGEDASASEPAAEPATPAQ